MMRRIVILFVGILVSSQYLEAQQNFDVTLIYDSQQQDFPGFQNIIKTEIEALLSVEYNITFTEFFTNADSSKCRKLTDSVFHSKNANVLIGVGDIISRILSEKDEYPLPTIAVFPRNNQLSSSENTKEITSSIHNFIYIQSPSTIEKDLQTLVEISQARKVAVIVNPDFNIDTYTSRFRNIEFQMITLESDPLATLDSINDDIDAVYVLSPLEGYSSSQAKTLFQGIAARKIPGFSSVDDPMLEYGAYATFASKEDIQKIARRIALQVAKIAEGKDPKDFPVQMEAFPRQLIFNMEVVHKTGIYPNWDILDNAMLVNVNKLDAEHKLTLKSAVAKGLENNLEYHMAKKQTESAQQDVALAKSKYLPTLDAKSTGLFLDEHTVASAFGTKGDFNWTAGASFSQLILSEPAMANISIQKLLKESKDKAEMQSELDVVLDVATAYLNYQQAQLLVELRNENMKVKQQNLDIANNKEKVGYSGESDVYRWQTELALAKTDYNTSLVQLKTVQYRLNQLLNRPLNEEFNAEKPENSEFLSQVFDMQFFSLIENPGTTKILSDFLVSEAMNNLPEVQQIDLALKAQERLLKSKERAGYIPTIALAANYDYPIGVINPGAQLPIPGINISPSPTWNAAVVVSFPIFSGSSKIHEKKKSQIELYQLQDQSLDVRNKLELQVRANLEKVQTSYRNLHLANDAAQSAKKNAAVIQDLYSQGLVSITNVIDAQNASLETEINATNSLYQLIIDLFALERSTGNYLSLATESQCADFMSRFIQYKNNVKN